MSFKTVDGEAYTMDLLDAKIVGEEEYTVCFAVSSGVGTKQTDSAVNAHDVIKLQPDEESQGLQAAAEFSMNADFDLSAALNDMPAVSDPPTLGFGDLLGVMKKESKGKRTIQALGDKILLSKMLDNFGIPQMPVLFSCHGRVDTADVEALVQQLEASAEPDAFDIVVKPTHLSNSVGTVILSKEAWVAGGWDAAKLVAHMQQFLAQQADATESEALKALVPGFVVQKCYRSSVGFQIPLEMRVVTLWGKAHVGIWWWGHEGPPALRTSWLVRRHNGGNEQKDWDVLHRHTGYNPGFEAALKIFHDAMPAMASAAEAIAKASGAPFLRSDFFVGSPRWGVRLNEVAYGSGCLMMRKHPDSGMLCDDSHLVAKILRAGYQVAKSLTPEHFLSKLGVQGSSYESKEHDIQDVPALHIEALAEEAPKLSEETACALAEAGSTQTPVVPIECCKTLIFAPPPLPPAPRELEERSQVASAGNIFPVRAALPQQLLFPAPPGGKPGQLVSVMGPVGPLKVPLPMDVQPGQPFTAHFYPPVNQMVVLPQGARAGERVPFVHVSGETREAVVPGAMLPGQTLCVSNALMVAVPAGAAPGDQLIFTTPRYDQRMITVPEGKEPGEYIWTEI